jgi:polyribonucleotide nucleotidyltransferase
MDSIAMVEGEMKEISKQKCLKRLNLLHEHIKNQISAQRVYKLLWKKEVHYLEKEDEAIHAKVSPSYL